MRGCYSNRVSLAVPPPLISDWLFPAGCLPVGPEPASLEWGLVMSVFARLVGRLGCLGVLLVLSGLLPSVLHGQDSSTGAIRGTVTDTYGARIPRAEVEVRESATGIVRQCGAGPLGRFILEFLPPGDYEVRVAAPGMQAQLRPAVHVELGAVTELPFELHPAETKETITVTGEQPAVETQASGVSQLIDERAIAELPINGRRFSDLVLLTPGVTQDPRGQTSASNGDLSFGGIRGFQTTYLVDGADNNNSFFAQGRGRYRAPYQFSNEVVKEFRVSSNGYGAEHGRAGGAVINVVTRSGGNHVHGSAFYFLRDAALNARYPSLESKPKDRQQQFGFTLGGPIRRNRVFFFGGFDQHIFRVPTLVRFLDGTSALVPQPGQGPLFDGDYEDSDKALVFAAAGQLTQMAGNFQSALIGNAGFAKLDAVLSPHHALSARLSTSRYSGSNNVFFDPASPITNFAVSENGRETVSTASLVVSLNSTLSPRFMSHARAQLSRDVQDSSSNSSDPRTRIANVFDGFGRSSILPRQTHETRLHLAETLHFESGRNSWKFGGDALLTRLYNFFPSLFGGEYIFSNIRVDPFSFDPETFGLKLSPLRAYAHNVPRYYLQNFGSAVSHPNTNEYSAFVQDTVRLWPQLVLSVGVRYDRQTFHQPTEPATPFWAQAGRMPNDANNFAPRVGLAWSMGNDHPLVVRAGFGIFYTRIPQIYNSSVENDNGLNSFNLFLDNANFFDHQIFPTYPNPLVTCPQRAPICTPPPEVLSRLTAEVSAFSSAYRTPSVQQVSLSVEKELPHRITASLSGLHVHGQNLIRARDVNLPPPSPVVYPVYDATDVTVLGFYNVDSFSTWQFSRTLACPFPPCINDLARPESQLAAINQFETAGSSRYNGLTFSLQRRMRSGVYFRLGYTYAQALDDGQDALVAGRPAGVQNSANTSAERGRSVTDQRSRLVTSWIVEPHPFTPSQVVLGRLFNQWRLSGVMTLGSGRPVEARVTGDPNQDGNSVNDRLPGLSRNSLTGANYVTTDMRLGRRFRLGRTAKLELLLESFNLFNRKNKRLNQTDDGFANTAAQFVQIDKQTGTQRFPGHYVSNPGFLNSQSSYAPRQLQLAARFTF